MTYLNYADGDYAAIMYLADRNFLWDDMPLMCADCCERYLKHVLDVYMPESPEKAALMATNVLYTLSSAIKALPDLPDRLKPSGDLCMSLNGLDMYRRIVGHPSPDNVPITDGEIDLAVITTENTRQFVDRIEQEGRPRIA